MSNIVSIMNNSDSMLSFDDVLLVPRFSDIRSRLSVSTETNFCGKGMVSTLNIPLISSPMDTVTESDMAIQIGRLGGAGIVHRFVDKKVQLWNLLAIVRSNRDNKMTYAPVIPAIGVGPKELERLEYLMSGLDSIDAIAIDIANGHSSLMSEMISEVLRLTSGEVPIIAGNVATGDGLSYLADNGVSSVRVGIGGGSICKTRIMTGYGLPTLSSIASCYDAKVRNGYDISIIADGGVRYPSDLVKSISAGADSVMCGRVFAGTDESPGDVINLGERQMKLYRGMASSEAQRDRGTGLKKGTCSEGVSTHIEYSGTLSSVVEEFVGGLRSAMTYAGVSNIESLREASFFTRISKSSLDESHAFGTRK